MQTAIGFCSGSLTRRWPVKEDLKFDKFKTPAVLSGSLEQSADLAVLIAEANASVAATVHQEDYEPGRTLHSVYSSKCSQLQEKNDVLPVGCSLQDLAEPLPCLLPISSWQCTHPGQVWHPKAKSPVSNCFPRALVTLICNLACFLHCGSG